LFLFISRPTSCADLVKKIFVPLINRTRMIQPSKYTQSAWKRLEFCSQTNLKTGCTMVDEYEGTVTEYLSLIVHPIKY